MPISKFLSLLVLFFLASYVISQTAITWEQGKAMSISFSDLNDPSEEGLKVVVKSGHLPLFGTWFDSGTSWTFRPVVAFTQGMTYQVQKSGEVVHEFQIDHQEFPKTEIINIYPSLDTVPENLLKIYLRFSQPMGEQLSEGFINVVNNQGDTIEKVFLPLQPELWNEMHDLLTLWLDPGRIKRDLGPHQWLGSPLRKNQSYQIFVSSEWKDQNGKHLDYSFEKNLVATDADRKKPNPANWDINAPRSDSQDLLIINFVEPMDYALARECLRVIGDREISGQVILENSERLWCFTPANHWAPGQYKIQIESRLEDLAGNNLNRLFDAEITDKKEVRSELHFYYLDFQIE